MAIEVFQGASIPRELSSAAMEFLWVKWKTLSATNTLSLQRLTEESSHELRANATWLLSTGDDFVYMYMGDTIQAAAGFNPTGQLLSASDSIIARDLIAIYRQVAKTLAPSFVRFTGFGNGGQIWQGLVLPIRLAPGAVLLVCHFELVSHQTEVCEYLFRTSRDPMIAASPVANELGDVIDGWVVLMNDAARELLNFRDAIGNLRLKHLPALHGIELGFRLHPPVPDGTVSRIVTGEIDVEVIRFAQAFVLRLHSVREATEQAATLAPA